MSEEETSNFSYDFDAVAQELHVRPEILKRLVESFSVTLAGKVVQLDELVPAKDVEKIRAIMHEVKGTSGNLRLTKVYESADKMHVAVKAEEPQEAILEYFNAFKVEATAFFQSIKKE